MEEKPFSMGLIDHFAMMVPKGPFIQFNKPKPISFWKKALCFLMGHQWGSAGISYVGPGFPRKCRRCKREKWFEKPTLRMRFNKWCDKILDILWVPLCKVGIHRWKSHFGFSSFSYGKPGLEPTVKQHIYKCSCCKKTKTVNL